MNQEEYRQLYKKQNKNWNDSVSIYKLVIKEEITPEKVVLEAGCGFSDLFKDDYKKARKVIGVDIDETFLNMNNILDTKICANLENMNQVKSSSVDLIISSWVFEHIKSPQLAFREFERVLKKGGKVIFLTPNKRNFVVIFNRVIPVVFRKWVISHLNKNLVTDPMTTFYKANTVSEIKKLSGLAGLKVIKIILNGDPTYLAINKPFYLIGKVIERFLNLPVLNKTRVHLIGILEK